MDVVKKSKKKLLNNRNRSDRDMSEEQQVLSHNREVSQRIISVIDEPSDEPILILDSDDNSNHSTQSNIQCISDDEEPPNAVEQMPDDDLPRIISYGSINDGYLREFFMRNGFPVFENNLTTVNLISDDEDDEIL